MQAHFNDLKSALLSFNYSRGLFETLRRSPAIVFVWHSLFRGFSRIRSCNHTQNAHFSQENCLRVNTETIFALFSELLLFLCNETKKRRRTRRYRNIKIDDDSAHIPNLPQLWRSLTRFLRKKCISQMFNKRLKCKFSLLSGMNCNWTYERTLRSGCGLHMDSREIVKLSLLWRRCFNIADNTMHAICLYRIARLTAVCRRTRTAK